MRRSIILLLAVGLVSGWCVTGHGAVKPGAAVSADELLCDRPWADHMPKGDDDRTRLFLFTEDGIGLQGLFSRFSWSAELFEFVESGSQLQFHYLVDHAKVGSKFTVRKETNGEFDLVLELGTDPARRGSTAKYYSRVDWKDAKARPSWLTAAMKRLGD